jgi:hypothetical protein
MQPSAQNGTGSQRSCLADQDDKRRLKCVIGVGPVTQNSPTDTQDHRAMPMNQGGECGFIARVKKLRQELPVGLIIGAARMQRFDQCSKVNARTAGRHVLIPNSFCLPLPDYSAWNRRDLIHDLSIDWFSIDRRKKGSAEKGDIQNKPTGT